MDTNWYPCLLLHGNERKWRDMLPSPGFDCYCNTMILSSGMKREAVYIHQVRSFVNCIVYNRTSIYDVGATCL